MAISFGREPSEYEKIVEFVRSQSNGVAAADKVDYDLEQEKILRQPQNSNISDMSRWLPKGTKVEELKLGDTEGFKKATDVWTQDRINDMKATESEPKHPDYYKGKNEDGKAIEVFDIIDQFVDGDFYLGNVLKYVCRAGKKSKETKRQDLEKALHYIKEAIKRI